MAELTLSNAFAGGEVTGTKAKSESRPSKDKVNCILNNLDKKANFTIGDVVILDKMDEQQRATTFGLDSDKYNVSVNKENGIVKIFENGKLWLKRVANKDKSNTTPKDIQVIPIDEVENVPHIYYVKDHNKVVSYTGPEDLHQATKQMLPYVENGSVKVVSNGFDSIYTYKNGHLIKSEYRYNGNNPIFQGEYSVKEYSSTGYIKSMEGRELLSGEQGHLTDYKCSFDNEGNLVNGEYWSLDTPENKTNIKELDEMPFDVMP